MRLGDLVTALLAHNIEHGAKAVRTIDEEKGEVSNIIGVTVDHDTIYLMVEDKEEL